MSQAGSTEHSHTEATHSHDHSHSHDHAHDSHNQHVPHSHAGHSHITGHDHDQGGDTGWLARLAHLVGLHHHSHTAAALDSALTTNERGIRAVQISMVALLVTAFLQLFLVYFTGSVALLADTVHNFSDALTAIPLWLAFSLGRRPRNQRYTYGYGRAEDLAGVLIVIMIFLSSVEIFREAIDRFLNPRPVENLMWVAIAAIVGFIGNELVALFRMRVGREIGSAALVADGLHARTDGLTSLGVLVGAIGVWLGFPLADPIVAVLIGVVILGIVWQAARDMWYRLMDAIDPAISNRISSVAHQVPGVLQIYDVSARWIGHRMRGELRLGVDDQMTTAQGHEVAEQVQHALMHEIPELTDLTIHVDPFQGGSNKVFHELTAHHYTFAETANDKENGDHSNGKPEDRLPPTPKNDYAKILRPARGIQVIDDITAQFGVETMEGKIGPLLQGVGSRAHYIQMPAGSFLYEHPHPTEAIIYTVTGQWVLCTEGKRHLMKPRSIYWFGPDIAAGYEVPFDEPATILIFKGERGWEPDEFVDYLENKLRPNLIQENKAGQAFLIDELPPDHPARVFAHTVNPGRY